MLAFPSEDLEQNPILWEYAVPVTDNEFDFTAIGQLYRDRCENGFDELKSQWGWGGLTTQELHRNQLTAQEIALVSNWWRRCVRLAKPEARGVCKNRPCAYDAPTDAPNTPKTIAD